MAARIAIHDRDLSAWPCDSCFIGTDTLARRNVFKCDSEIRFEEGPHKYYVHGSSEPARISVTTLVHSMFAPFDPVAVVRKMPEATKAAKYAGMTDKEIVACWSSNAAALAGTRMHAAIETFFNTYDFALQWGFLSADPILEVEMTLFRGWMRDQFLRRRLVPVRTEMLVHGSGVDVNTGRAVTVAGSIDMIARSAVTNEFYILDWKRAKKLTKSATGSFGYADAPCLRQFNLENVNFVHYSLQLHIYRYMLMNFCGFPDIPVRNLYLVLLHPDNAVVRLQSSSSSSGNTLLVRTGYHMEQCADYSHIVPTIFKNLDILAEKHESFVPTKWSDPLPAAENTN